MPACAALLRNSGQGVHHVPFMVRALRPLFGALLAVCFSANALAPGLLHGCESGAVTLGVAAVAGGHAAAHQHPAEAPSGPQPERSGQDADGCDCVGHSCCVAAPALPAATITPLKVTLPAPAAAVGRDAVPAALRPERLLPFAQAPPA
jgi:hypothetical protein